MQGSLLYGANANGPGGVTYCAISPSDGTLSNCTVTAANSAPNGTDALAVGSNYAYVGGTSPDVCAVGGDGSLTGCATTPVASPRTMTLSDGYLYLAGATGTIESCAVNGDGTLGTCNTNPILSGADTIAIAIAGNTAYVTVRTSNQHVYACSLSAGALTNCILSDGGGTYTNVWGMAVD